MKALVPWEVIVNARNSAGYSIIILEFYARGVLDTSMWIHTLCKKDNRDEKTLFSRLAILRLTCSPPRLNSERCAETRHLRDLDNNSSRKGSPQHTASDTRILDAWFYGCVLFLMLVALTSSKATFTRWFNYFWHFHLFPSPHLTVVVSRSASWHAALKFYTRNWFIFGMVHLFLCSFSSNDLSSL